MYDGKKIYIKLSFIGEGGVGKTSLVNYITKGKSTDTDITKGFNFQVLGNQRVKLMIWDIGGQKRFRRFIDEKLLKGTIIGVFVFDLTRPKTLERLVEDWLMGKNLNRIPVKVLVGNKKDLSVINGYDWISELATEYGFNKVFITSAKTGEGVDNLKNFLMEIVKRVGKTVVLKNGLSHLSV